MSDPVTRLGKYSIVRRIAKGGMAELFLARQEGPAQFSKLVAIKQILPTFAENAEFVAMFLNEARLAAMLNHPSVVHIYELGEEDGSYYIAMEYIEGEQLGKLAQMLERMGRFIDPRIAAAVCMRVAEGLAYAHDLKDGNGKALSLVHRDVSPDNILVSTDGNVKIVDFGIAKAASVSPQTRKSVIKGKTAFMSPEQVRGKPLDGRSDVFSLGIVLYTLTTGVPPFRGESEMATLSAVVRHTPAAPRKLRPNLSKELEKIIERSLEKETGDRYQHASEMASALQEYLLKSGGLVSPKQLADFVQSTREEYKNWKATNGTGPTPGLPPTPKPSSGTRVPSWAIGVGAGALAAAAVVVGVVAVKKPAEVPPPVVAEVQQPLPKVDEPPVKVAVVEEKVPEPVIETPVADVVSPEVVAPEVVAAEVATVIDAGVATAPTVVRVAAVKVSIASTPSADVFVGGRRLGSTPLEATLPPSKLKLTFVNASAGLKRTVAADVSSPGGRALIYKFRPGSLVIDAPAGAGIYIDNKRLGKAPISKVELLEGEHTVRVIDALGGKNATAVVEVRGGEEVTKTFRF